MSRRQGHLPPQPWTAVVRLCWPSCLLPPLTHPGKGRAWMWSCRPARSPGSAPWSLLPRYQALQLPLPPTGGLAAVIYTDALQTLIMVVGAVILTVKGEGYGLAGPPSSTPFGVWASAPGAELAQG